MIIMLFHKFENQYRAWPHGRLKMDIKQAKEVMALFTIENRAYGGNSINPVFEIHGIMPDGIKVLNAHDPNTNRHQLDYAYACECSPEQ